MIYINNIFRNKSGYADRTAGLEIKRADRRSKYRNIKTTSRGITFDSRKEALRYNDLLLLQRVGKITDLKRQVLFELIPPQGGERGVSYYADFTYCEDGKSIAEDVKGIRTSVYIIKRKLFKWRYPEYVFRET